MRHPPAVRFHETTLQDLPANPHRRRLLKLMAASTALAGTGCTQAPPEKIMPYVNMPEGMVPGDPVFYASTLLRNGFGIGVLVETESGRPIKIEGNTAHPASLGAADAQTQAAILTLWDPERSHTIMHRQEISTREAMLSMLIQRLDEESQTGGRGLRLLTGPVSSPTLLSQINAMLMRFPNAQWHMHDPADSDARAAAALQVFGVPARTLYHLEQAAVVLSVDADLFGPSADGVRNAHDFLAARRRNPRARMYALESSPNLCGSLADSRQAMSPGEMENMLEMMAAALSNGAAALSNGGASLKSSSWLNRLYRQLLRARGACVVAAGHSLSLRAHVLVWHINTMLGNLGKTVYALEQYAAQQPGKAPGSGSQTARPRRPASLPELTEAMRNDQVSTLVMVNVNPVYDAPGMLAFAPALEHVPCSIHTGLYYDETGRRATWHVPQTHELESWSDAYSHDGIASIVQPVIAPLYGAYSSHELMSVLASGQTASAHATTRATWQEFWQARGEAEFEQQWQAALSCGVIASHDKLHTLHPLQGAFDALKAESGAQPDARPPNPPGVMTPSAAKPSSATIGITAVLANDSNLVAGEFANNAWLQELPRPYSKITWDNAALISPASARQHALCNGDIVSLSTADDDTGILAPIWIMPGQANGVITLPLGYGRSHAGNTAQGHGFDVFALQGVNGGLALRTFSVTMRRTGQRHDFAVTQHELHTQGREPVRNVETRRDSAPSNSSRVSEPARARARSGENETPSLYPGHEYSSYAWGMTVDLDACIGCNACAIACQAENNIPVVGPEQVAMGREMHWIRIDLYREQSGNRTQFQPMACQHCENAPCEIVCPVGATMHDSEGLNIQVYNRCVGTRFCSNNCPYKVRHFNFFQFSRNDPSAAAHANPDVTVRQRGVMEKCTYCLQRISHARIQAQKAGRPIRDGDIVTACQATCPTNAIVFGDTNDPDSEVSRSKASPRNYAVLEELNTRPRTTYLARLDDPAARLEEDDD